MPDIALRFHKDMLVLSAPIDAVLARQGVDVEHDREFIHLIEPEAVRDAYVLENVAGAQCLVTNTAGITEARLTHAGMEGRGVELATAALTILHSLKPQHVLAEIGTSGLPLDGSSEASREQSRTQYAQAVAAFGTSGYDALLFRGMTDPVDMECALQGAEGLATVPLLASIDVTKSAGDETCLERLVATLRMMEQAGADVVGFTAGWPLDKILAVVKEARPLLHTPLLVELTVGRYEIKQTQPSDDNPYYSPDTMIDAATELRGAGVQFLRAVGDATPAYTGALVAASAGFDVIRK